VTDLQLAEHYEAVKALDRDVRAVSGDERAHAQAVARQVGAVKRELEQWIVARHTRAHAAQAAGSLNGG
jgi:hypothetical protein